MSADGHRRRISTVKTLLDVLIILGISVAAECAHFTWKQGRHVICADSVQYVDGAEALLSPDKIAHFEFRKPGYSLILAAAAIALGNMGWAAVVVNHLFQAVLPLAAYCLGRNLRSRLVGWVAAILLVAQLQFHYRAERIMSEASYTTVLTLAILLCAVGLSGRRQRWWMMTAGFLFGFAWLIRSIAVVAVAAAVGCLLWQARRRPFRASAACLCLLAPLAGAVLFECGLNHHYVGRFKTGTGTLGLTLLIRARYFEGLPFPETEAARQCSALLPERDPEDAYRANKLDGWVGWYRAVHDQGVSEWAFDDLARRAAGEVLTAHPGAYLRSTCEIFLRQLLRRAGGASLSRVPAELREPVLVPADAHDDQDAQQYWYSYWALPHRTQEEARSLVARMKAAAEQRAPLGRLGLWSELRYWSLAPAVVDVLSVLRGVGSLWPGFALLLCGPLGLNRRTCALLAGCYILEAAVVGATSFSDLANARFQYVWLATDAALAAALVTPILRLVGESTAAQRASRLVTIPRQST